MKRQLKIIISGGGTGGHIYPAIAIADEIMRRFPRAEILFVGAKGRMEMEKVPQAGYRIEGLWITGLERKLSLKNMSFPFKLVSSLWKSNEIIKNFNPDVVIGTGGFASGPLLKVASSKHIPSLIQEQNSLPGVTNRLLGNHATIICTAYDNLEKFFPADKIKKTGNPVRQDILGISEKRKEAQSFFKLKENKKTVLVLGGSLGARRVNHLIEAFQPLFKERDVQLIWQTGSLYYEEYKKFDTDLVQTHAFLNRMDLAYAAADVIISRAGAGSVSELCIVGKPVLFIPSPNVAEDHQTKNAMAVANKKAAVVLKEEELVEKFKDTILSLLESKNVQQELSENIKKLALPNATSAIVDEVEKLINQRENRKMAFGDTGINNNSK
ncbi:undecaprenyldiphospho-muramoylpentapeptide beta-N-acetylglucosaminyltransferase [Gillisia limnaea]|uniref:UDP-N-acetylglucosamine--N-acetylmuramyl-(pentapeptide) pyrophosphoryl-undecaprenol N-acetylglucosamine transferase n=1 Tax=Gillisia limnaea (strain DSM 15749 / LMG 21470 / R-8282) TaxID=865937 RepID=H2BY68_GILLR|nr:undecaprenyldiphospho-muramoylpentapeptide beta-N-acetylglucosaminyltransferase [Gillisia limnaea]EHQ02160.1 UDP-N-acetylglucosamine--N-acetylmuramyl-(pentapeptide) pyrophosphoryl-undecaprenol N-acetylglucosamine transferase [Gillisia limnaea DSM 15749]